MDFLRDFSFERQLVRIQLEEILDAAEIAEETIRRRLRDIDSRWDESGDDWSDEEKLYHQDKLVHEIFRVQEVFAQVLRRSLFIAAYAILEQGLDRLCVNAGAERNFQIAPGDLKHRGITRSEVYLTKVIGLSFPVHLSEWKRIKIYGEFRNYLVHSGPALNRGEPSKQLLRQMQGLDDLTLEEGEEVVIRPGFLPCVVSDFRKLFDEVYAALDNRPIVQSE